MDTLLQTALPVLDPEQSKDLLEFHYSWRYMIEQALEMVGTIEWGLEYPKLSPRTHPAQEGDVLADALKTADLEVRRLHLRHLSDEAEGMRLNSRPEFLTVQDIFHLEYLIIRANHEGKKVDLIEHHEEMDRRLLDRCRRYNEALIAAKAVKPRYIEGARIRQLDRKPMTLWANPINHADVDEDELIEMHGRYS